MARNNRGGAEVNSSSMADIAFLLLVFFLVTTTIPNDKGLMVSLPQKQFDEPLVKLKERNVFKVRINSSDRLMVEEEELDDVSRLKDLAKEHIMNPNGSDQFAETPKAAIISLKNDRGTSYEMFISVLDQLQAAYYEIYGERVGLTSQQYRNLDRKNAAELELYEKGKEGLPMAISIAQPSSRSE